MGSPVGPSPHEAEPLSAREQTALALIEDAERHADRRFVDDLAAGRVREPFGPLPRVVAFLGALLAVGVLAGLAAGPWFPSAALLAVVVALLVALPLGLVTWAAHQDRLA